MGEGFTKLFGSIITSSMWSEDDKTRLVWITMLALADENGYVGASPVGLAHAARVSLEDALKAIDKLMKPDPYSRSKVAEGRRIEEVDGGWIIVNYGLYRSRARVESKREYMRDYMRKKRELTTVNEGLTDVNPSAFASPSQNENEEVQEGKEKDGKPSRRRFIPPDPLAVAEYASSIGYEHLANFPEEFINFYTANGWKVGKNSMKDWRASVRTWKSRNAGNDDRSYAKI